MATGTGNLPFPGKVYNPFDILTAQELNEDVSNIESLATGTGIGDGSVATAALADAAVKPQKLGLGGVTASGRTGNIASTTYVDLSTGVMSLTTTVNSSALVLMDFSNGATTTTTMNFTMSGANTLATPNAAYEAYAGTITFGAVGNHAFLTSLSPGSTTFTAKFKADTNASRSVSRVSLTVIPLG